MEMRFSAKEKIVGAFLVFTILLVIGSLIVIGRGKAWFREHISYYIVFDEGYNLKEGAVVKILNTDVGTVSSIRITPKHKVGVRIKVLKDHANLIRKDSVAVVDSPTVIGSEYISISAGSPKSPPINEGEVIPSKRKKSLSDYAEEFQLEQKFNALTRILHGVEQTVDQLKDADGPLLGTLWDLRSITDDVKNGHGIGTVLVKDEFYQRLDQQMDHLETILVNLEKTSQEVERTSQAVPKNVETVAKIIEDIKETSQNLKAASQSIKSASRDVPDIARSTRDNLNKVDQILESAKRNPLIKGGIPQQDDGIVRADITGMR